MSMTQKEFKKIAQLLNRVYKELEMDALAQGVSPLSTDYDAMQADARERVLTKMGFTLDEYREAKNQIMEEAKDVTLQEVKLIMDELRSIPQLKMEDVQRLAKDAAEKVAEEVAQKYIVPPQITNQIIKETTVEKPITIETIREVKIIEEYDATYLEEQIVAVRKKLQELKIPPPYDDSKIREFVKNYFSENFEKNINLLGMPNFRQLAIGLRQDIDIRVVGDSDNKSIPKLTVGYTEPVSPKLYDLWYDLN
jgi:hypothetical protein